VVKVLEDHVEGLKKLVLCHFFVFDCFCLSRVVKVEEVRKMQQEPQTVLYFNNICLGGEELFHQFFRGRLCLLLKKFLNDLFLNLQAIIKSFSCFLFQNQPFAIFLSRDNHEKNEVIFHKLCFLLIKREVVTITVNNFHKEFSETLGLLWNQMRHQVLQGILVDNLQ
jgi:hypothetical protein